MNPGKCSEAIRAFLAANPGATREQIKAAAGYSSTVFGQAFRTLRKRQMIVVEGEAVTLGRPLDERRTWTPEEAAERARMLRRERQRRRRQARAALRPPREKKPPKPRIRKARPPKPPKAAKPPKPPKAKSMPAPKPLHPIQAANDAAWALAQDKRETARKVRVETEAEFVARGGVIEVLPPTQYVTPTAIPMRLSFRGKGSMG